MPAPFRLPPWPSIAMLLLAALPVRALKGLRPDGGLDRPAISKAYFEGESWTVINALEAYRRSAYRGTREDSVYVLKYLGVVYAADPATRAKADACLRELLRLEPGIDLSDLYLPDSIQRMVARAGKDAARAGVAPPAPPGGSPGNAQGTPAPPPAADSAVPADAAGKVPASARTPPDTAGPGPAAGAPPAPLPAPPGPPPEARRADAAPPAGAPPAPAEGEPVAQRSRAWIWPVALGGAGVAAMTVFLIALDAGAGSDDDELRPVDVTLEWPVEGSP